MRTISRKRTGMPARTVRIGDRFWRPVGLFVSVLFLALSLGATAKSLPSDRRVALVIGNAEYRHTGRLSNPINDARALRDKLKTLRFEVDYYENLNHDQMVEHIADFYQDKARKSDIRFIYFAGHGVEFNGHNYLLPIESNALQLAEIPRNGYELDELRSELNKLERGVNIIVLDTCRVSSCPAGERCRGLMQTLELGKERLSWGSLVAYSTGPGERASDDRQAQHSVYTESLLELLDIPGLSVDEIFRQLNEIVFERSGGRQQPEFVNGLKGRKVCLHTAERGDCAA